MVIKKKVPSPLNRGGPKKPRGRLEKDPDKKMVRIASKQGSGGKGKEQQRRTRELRENKDRPTGTSQKVREKAIKY